MSDQDNPYQSPESTGEHREKCKSMFRTTQSEEGPDGDLFHYYYPWKFYARLAIPLIFLWGVLGIEYPLIWAYGTGILLVMAFGLLTTKLICNFQRPLYVWGLAPIFGVCWMLFFWIVYMFVE